MARIIAIANQKGGVGKTTTCVNLCAALCRMGKRVLLVDGDPQGNASSGMGVSKARKPNTYDLLINGSPAEDCIVHTEYGDVIPTGNATISEGNTVVVVKTGNVKIDQYNDIFC